jgi:hypothetical protein
MLQFFRFESYADRKARLRSWLRVPERARHPLVWVWPFVAVGIAYLSFRLVTTAKELSDVISAFAALLWPAGILAMVGWFKPEIQAILSRVKKGKFLGLEFELDELQAKTDVAETTGPMNFVISGAGSSTGTGSVSADGARIDATESADIANAEAQIEEVLREASRSPRMGLMLLSAKMDRAARELASDFGVGAARTSLSLRMLTRQLLEAEQLTREDAAALDLFSQVRNRIVHGHDADDDEIARAIDSGTRLLRILLARKRLP